MSESETDPPSLSSATDRNTATQKYLVANIKVKENCLYAAPCRFKKF